MSATERSATGISPAAPVLAPSRELPPRTRVLLVEDNPADADLLVEQLAAAPGDAAELEVMHVDRLSSALGRVREGRVDLVLLDLSLPDASGLEALTDLVCVAPEVPIVVMTGLADDRTALAAVQHGAQDYLVKGEDDGRVVRRAIRYALERHRLRREGEELLDRERAARAAAERAAHVRDEVLGIVSHDLRNPLSTIVMAASALASGGDTEPSELAGMIKRSGEWALRIIRDLLDVTTIESGRLSIHREPMTIQAITERIHSLFRMQAAEAGVGLGVAVNDAPRWVEVDVDRIVQALGNLVANALKFTPRGGDVWLMASRRGPGAVAFRVSDTGPGIPAEHLPHLFDRFWQARESRRGGAGLGLAIARGIAEGHGGTLSVESIEGQGCTFTLVVPRVASTRSSATSRRVTPGDDTGVGSEHGRTFVSAGG